MYNSTSNKIVIGVRHYLAALAFLAVTLATGTAGAQSQDAQPETLISAFTSVPSGAIPLPTANNTTAAGEFTLTSSASITSAILSLKINTDPLVLADLSVKIMGSTSDFPNSTVFAASTGDAGNLSTNRNPIGFAFAAAPVLAAGTYWLELYNSSSSGGVVGWAYAAPTSNTGTDGTVNNLALFNGNVVNAGQIFSLQGNLTATPEPAALTLLGLGVGAVAWLRRRQSV